jgi:hypothetical protein
MTQKSIQKFGASFLYVDVKQIRSRSGEKGKYDFILERLKNFKDNFKSITRSEVIYIAPAALKNKMPGQLFLPFSEFPEHINHPYSDQWKELRKFFDTIDQPATKMFLHSSDEEANIASGLAGKIKFIAGNYNKTPELIWFGKMGGESNPNFQIQFTDGSIQAFYHSGKEYTRALKFNSNNLRGPHNVKDYL